MVRAVLLTGQRRPAYAEAPKALGSLAAGWAAVLDGTTAEACVRCLSRHV